MHASKAQIASRCHRLPRLQFNPQANLTSFAGLVLLQAFFEALSFKPRLRRAMRPFERGHFGLWRLVMLLIVHLILGFDRLRDLDLYRDDPMVRRLLALRRLPDVSTLSRHLAEATHAECEALRAFNREIVEDRLRSLHPRELTVDFDGTRPVDAS